MQRGHCYIVDSIDLVSPKTQLLSRCIGNIGLANQRLLIVTPGFDMVLLRASNNLPNVTVAPATELNASAIIRNRAIVFLRQSLSVIGVPL